MNSENLKKHIHGFWDSEIVPTLVDYIKIGFISYINPPKISISKMVLKYSIKFQKIERRG